MSLTFESPVFLWLLLLCVPVAITGLRWLHSMSRARAISAVVARVGVLTLITLVLAGAAAVRTSDRLATIIVVDVSQSVTQLGEEFATLTAGGERVRPSRAMREFIDRAAGVRSPDDLLGVVVFDAQAMATALPTAGDELAFDITRSMSPGSDIAQALRFAETLFPPDAARRLVLISDGNATGGDPVEAARELAAINTPIDVVPIPYSVRNEVMIEAVDTPPQSAQGATVAVRVVLRATDAATGRLRLVYEGEQLDISPGLPGRDRPVSLNAGINTVVVEVPLDRERILHRIEPVFIPDDPAMDRIAANNTAESFTVTPGPGRVLIVRGQREADNPNADTLAAIVRNADIAIDVVNPGLIPGDLLALQAYDLVVLQNVSAGDVPRNTQQILSDYVTRLGGGLIMTGGRDAFGAGGWITSPLAEILPVELEIPDDIVSSTVAVALVIDRSGSMLAPSLLGGRSQMEIATESAALAVETLGPTDMVTVISFSSNARTEIPLQRNTEPQRNAQRVRGIAAGGGTSIIPALELAFDELRDADAAVKHIIFLTDGMDPAATTDAPLLAAKVYDAGITVTTIALGGSTDTTMLENMATAGGGAFYEVLDPNILPRLFVSEVRMARQPLIREQPFEPVTRASGSPVLIGVGSPPLARGLVLTQHREEPTVTRAIDHPDGFPVLAHWFAGRGQVGVFTSDAGGRWTNDWLDWGEFDQFWRQFVRTVAQPSTGESGQLSAQVSGDELIVRYESYDEGGRPRDLMTVTAQIYNPDGTQREIRLSQTGPGTYEARAEAGRQGSYVVVVSPSQAGSPLPPTIGGATRALSPEFQHLRSNIATLRAIAEASSGRLIDLLATEPGALFDRAGIEPRRAALPIWPALLAWCLALFVLDVATRRIAWDRLITRELVEEMRESAGSVVRERSAKAAATVAALRRPSGAAEDAGPGVPRREQAPAPVERRAPAGRTGGTAAAGDRGDQEQSAEARAREQRRAELRRQTLARLAGSQGGAQSAPPEKHKETKVDPAADPKGAKPGADTSPRNEPSRSSLLDAKRRARARYAEGEEN